MQSPLRPPDPSLAHSPAPRRAATGALASAAARHPARTIVAWLVVLGVSIAATVTFLGDALTQDGDVTVELEAAVAADLVDQARGTNPDEAAATEYVVIESPAGTRVDAPGNIGVVADLATTLRTTPHVTSVTSPSDGVPGLIGADGRHALLVVALDQSDDAEVTPLLQALDTAQPDGWRFAALGNASVGHEFDTLAEDTLVRGELLGLSIALLVLVVVFGALAAALVPIGLAIVSVILALGLASLVGLTTDLSLFVVNMITMIGLAVGIDYSLFIVQRFREERRHGHDTVTAITVAGSTATRAVVFSGVTVIVALLGMMLMPDTTFRSLGIGAIVVVLAAVLAALTLLPAILGLLGDRVNALALPWRRRAATGRRPVRPVAGVGPRRADRHGAAGTVSGRVGWPAGGDGRPVPVNPAWQQRHRVPARVLRHPVRPGGPGRRVRGWPGRHPGRGPRRRCRHPRDP